MRKKPEVNDAALQKTIDDLCASGQEHIFMFWDELSKQERADLLAQLREIDVALVNDLIVMYKEEGTKVRSLNDLRPAEVIPVPKTDAQRKEYAGMVSIGEEKLRQGKVGCFVVAGGQSTRLGFDAPKGTYKVGPVTGRSLFQYHAEKILALGKKYNAVIPWYIMTSKYNSKATRDFFTAHNYFGLPEKDIFFLEQGMLPSVTFEGKLILDAKNHIAMNPDGHGGVIRAIRESKALDDMKRRGIEHMFYFQIDNVLVKVADPAFTGYHVAAGADMSSKIVQKSYPEEKLGVIGEVNGTLCVVEYSELTKEDMYAVTADGSLKYGAGSIAIHEFSVDFLDRLANSGETIPYHMAKKKVKHIDAKGTVVAPEEPNAVKFEAFIFDALGRSRKSVTIETKREEDFSPLKNKTGVDSPETVKKDLLNLYGGWLEAAGVRIPRGEDNNISAVIEISPVYALDQDDFLKKAPKDITYKERLLLE